MTQNSTPSSGPSAASLDFIRRFAREYKPESHKGKTIIFQMGETKPLGIC